MKRYVVVVLLTVAAVAAGAWWYLRDEYPMQVAAGDIVALDYSYRDANGLQFGVVRQPPPELASWIGAWERDTSDQEPVVTTMVAISLRDGRRLRLDAGGTRGFATWIAADGTVGETLAVHFNSDFVWYVQGLWGGHGGEPAVPAPESLPTSSPSGLPGSPPSSAATPSK